MIFTPDNCQLILDGRKTQTRRVMREDHYIRRRDGRVALVRETVDPFAPRVIYQVGGTYAIQPGRGEKAVGRIRVTAIRRERLQEIGPHDALAEGVTYPHRDECPPDFRAVEAYRELWESIHGSGSWERNDRVAVIEFEVINKEQA